MHVTYLFIILEFCFQEQSYWTVQLGWMDFSIGSTHAVLIKFTTEFSFESVTAELNKCDVFATVTVTGLPTNGIKLGH